MGSVNPFSPHSRKGPGVIKSLRHEIEEPKMFLVDNQHRGNREQADTLLLQSPPFRKNSQQLRFIVSSTRFKASRVYATLLPGTPWTSPLGTGGIDELYSQRNADQSRKSYQVMPFSIAPPTTMYPPAIAFTISDIQSGVAMQWSSVTAIMSPVATDIASARSSGMLRGSLESATV